LASHKPVKPTPEPGESWGLLGGAFDPIHRGHLTLARDVLAAKRLAGVLFVPSLHPPHRAEPCLASFDHRCAMVERAIADDQNFVLSAIEQENDLSGYTLHTIQALKKRYPDVNWSLIVGADHAKSFATWYRPLEILAEVRLIIGARPGYDLSALGIGTSERIETVQSGLVDLSASQIRQHILTGIIPEELSALVPPAVAAYITEHHLYRP
jgi:nicotinate-nucleotide adenylyltransferase